MKIDRTLYLDYLRVLATFVVVLLHVAAANWNYVDVNGFNWMVFNIYDSAARWAVPVFVMISGALFLDRTVSIKQMYSKYILRIAIAYFVWNTFYACFEASDSMDFIKRVITGHFHMWFLPMIIGLYMLLPIIKQITANRNVRNYYIVLGFIFAFLIPTFVMVSNDFFPKLINSGVKAINDGVINGLSLNMVLGFGLYFVLGQVINHHDISKGQRMIIYLLGLCGLIITIMLTYVVTVKTQVANGDYYGNFTVSTFLEGIAVFTFIKYHHPNSDKLNRIIVKLSRYSFGAFLVHPCER